ncbi:hypothetical protein [Streptomyces sp. NPDC097619]|uniref:hypothetical protein n=1 Tax=Streptomyces sp. NPDC097619 TaxID=3157228 RepID=UPI00332B1CBC
MDGVEKVGAWLGAAGSVIAIMMFLGVDSFDDLGRTLGRPDDAADRKVCQEWNRLLQPRSPLGESDAEQSARLAGMGREFKALADRAEKPVLREAVMNFAADYMAWSVAVGDRGRFGGWPAVGKDMFATQANNRVREAEGRARSADLVNVQGACASLEWN